MADYIVQKPIDLTKLTAKAKTQIGLLTNFDITPKFDGCCAVLCFDARGEFAGAFSATGEYAPSMERIGTHIAQRWVDRPLRDTALIGEAWIPGAEFPVINGTFRRQRVQPELRFAPFDAVRYTPNLVLDKFVYPILADERAYGERLTALDGRLFDPDYLVMVEHYTGDLMYADMLARGWKAKGGYDGAIARLPDAPYVVGRCKFEVVKVKPLLDLDLRVIELTETVGEKTGRRVFTITVEYRGVRSEVGSGMPHKFEDLPALGQIVRIEAMGLTPDGKLREPRFIAIRDDKMEAD